MKRCLINNEKDLLPILKQGNVDVVASGHNHVQEHIKEGKIDYLIAGAGIVICFIVN